MTFAEDIMTIVKNTITISIRQNTHHRYIDWRGCDNICMDMHDCLDLCEESIGTMEPLQIMKAVLYILMSGVKLASSADSSSGMLTDVICRTYDMIDTCIKEIVQQDTKVRNEALTLIIKEAKKKAFDGWDSWRYELLQAGICLCDEKNAKKVEKALDVFGESAKEDSFPQYLEKEIIVTRYLLHRHLYGKDNVRMELQDNIQINELCIVAIEDAMEERDYAAAEKLCMEKVMANSEWHYRKDDPKDWNNMLYEIYKAANDQEKQLAQAKHILLMGNEKFWDELKKIYNKNGIWAETKEDLLEELKNCRSIICYRSILVEEKEYERLLEDILKNPCDLFYYGKFLVKDYPEQIYKLCYEVISEDCANARDRREYRKVTKQIAELIKWKGTETAKVLIADLREKYPRRSALQDELNKVEKKL